MSPTAHTRRLVAAGVSAVVGLAMVVTGAGPAGAASSVLCTGIQEATYDPPLTLVSRPTRIHFEENLSCPGGDFSVAHVEANIPPGALSCLLPGNLFPTGTLRYEWDGGESHSEITYTTTVVANPLGQTVVTAYGTVTDGSYEGASAVRVVSQITLSPLDCLSSGVESVSGPSTLTITQ